MGRKTKKNRPRPTRVHVDVGFFSEHREEQQQPRATNTPATEREGALMSMFPEMELSVIRATIDVLGDNDDTVLVETLSAMTAADNNNTTNVTATTTTNTTENVREEEEESEFDSDDSERCIAVYVKPVEKKAVLPKVGWALHPKRGGALLPKSAGNPIPTPAIAAAIRKFANPRVLTQSALRKLRTKTATTTATHTETIQINNTPTDQQQQQQQQQQHCIVCFEECVDSVGICDHVTCSDCWRQIAKEELSSKGTRASLTCPFPKCSTCLPDEEAASILEKGVFEQFQVRQDQHFVETTTNLRWCTQPGCECVIMSEFAVAVECQCGTVRCSQCGESPHFPCSCDDARLYRNSVDDSRQAKKASQQLTATAKLVKHCPACHVLIEKNLGCNHMICLRCGCHFCWLCGWRDRNHNDFSGHTPSLCPGESNWHLKHTTAVLGITGSRFQMRFATKTAVSAEQKLRQLAEIGQMMGKGGEALQDGRRRLAQLYPNYDKIGLPLAVQAESALFELSTVAQGLCMWMFGARSRQNETEYQLVSSALGRMESAISLLQVGFADQDSVAVLRSRAGSGKETITSHISELLATAGGQSSSSLNRASTDLIVA